MRSARLGLAGAVLVAAACVERVSAPGACPGYCPRGQLTMVDTLLVTNISRDSAFSGYVLPNQSTVLLAASLPSVDGRPIFRFGAYGPTLSISTTDTTTGPIVGLDSARLLLYITRIDTTRATNLTLQLYRLPKTIDTSTTFAGVAPAFGNPPVRTVNIDSLLRKPNGVDSATGDTIARDTLNHRLFLSVRLDSTAAPYVAADTGVLAFGIRVSADSFASIALGTGGIGPLFVPWVTVDSAGTPVLRQAPTRGAVPATYVFSPLPPPLDSTLAVGGVPSARSILRVALPRAIRDSSQILRATLVLVPAVAAQGAPSDSFVIEAHTVLADFGAKSPLALDVTRTDTAVIHVGSTDTVEIEVTNLLQFWQADSTQPTALVVRAKYEGQDFAQVRFYPSIAPAYRPALHVSYLTRFPFGKP